MANEASKDFNAMLRDGKDMPKIQIITDEKSIEKYGGSRMYFAPPLDYVPQALKSVEPLIVVETEQPIAFMGVQNGRLEMLFLAPEERGKGIGKRLLQYGIENYGIIELTVNEQNPQAVGFYEHMGFETYKRTALDEEGDPYPILYMKRVRENGI